MINPKPGQRYLYQDSQRKIICQIIGQHRSYDSKIEPHRYDIYVISSPGEKYKTDFTITYGSWVLLKNQDKR